LSKARAALKNQTEGRSGKSYRDSLIGAEDPSSSQKVFDKDGIELRLDQLFLVATQLQMKAFGGTHNPGNKKHLSNIGLIREPISMTN
jgi:hypothetical protein